MFRRKFSALILILFAMLAFIAAAETVKVLIVAGQSNMRGFVPVNTMPQALQDWLTDPNNSAVVYVKGSGVDDPYACETNYINTMTWSGTTGVRPGYMHAYYLEDFWRNYVGATNASFADQKVAVIYVSYGATSLNSFWNPGSDRYTSNSEGDGYTKLTNAIAHALNDLAGTYGAANVHVEGFSWWQGEGDCIGDEFSDEGVPQQGFQYYYHFDDLLNGDDPVHGANVLGLREYVTNILGTSGPAINHSFPGVAVRIGEQLRGWPFVGKWRPHHNAVRKAFQDHATNDNFDWVPNEDVPMADGYHYPQEWETGYGKIYDRLAKTVLELRIPGYMTNSAAHFEPITNSVDAKTAGDLFINFTQDVFKNSGSISIKKVSDDSVFESFDVASSPRITFKDSKTVRIDPTSHLAPNTEYYVTVDSTCFTNKIGGTASNLPSSSSDWRFTTGDGTIVAVFDGAEYNSLQDALLAAREVPGTNAHTVYMLGDETNVTSIGYLSNITITASNGYNPTIKAVEIRDTYRELYVENLVEICYSANIKIEGISFAGFNNTFSPEYEAKDLTISALAMIGNNQNTRYHIKDCTFTNFSGAAIYLPGRGYGADKCWPHTIIEGCFISNVDIKNEMAAILAEIKYSYMSNNVIYSANDGIVAGGYLYGEAYIISNRLYGSDVGTAIAVDQTASGDADPSYVLSNYIQDWNSGILVGGETEAGDSIRVVLDYNIFSNKGAGPLFTNYSPNAESFLVNVDMLSYYSNEPGFSDHNTYPPHNGIVFSNLSPSSVKFTNYESYTLNLSVDIVDTNGNITAAWIDLSQIGFPSSNSMNVSGDTYSTNITIPLGLEEGNYNLILRARDNQNKMGSAGVSVDVELPVNVALGKEVSVDTIHSTSDPIEVVVDGVRTGSNWMADDLVGEHWVEIDLGTWHTIGELRFYSEEAFGEYYFEVYDGASWSIVASNTSNPSEKVIDVLDTPVLATKVRMRGEDTDTQWINMYEFEAYERYTNGILFTNWSVNTTYLYNDVSSVLTFDANAIDDGSIASMEIDLSEFDGGSVVSMNDLGSGAYDYEYTVPISESAGTNRVILTATDDEGNERRRYFDIVVVIPGTMPPVNNAQDVSFSDNDANPGTVGGTIQISKAADEGDISHYNIYWGTNASSKSSLIASVSKTGADIEYELPHSTPFSNYILVYTSNAAGEASSPVATAVSDKTSLISIGYFDNFDQPESYWSESYNSYITGSGEGSNGVWTFQSGRIRSGGGYGIGDSELCLSFGNSGIRYAIFDGVDGNGFDGGIDSVHFYVRNYDSSSSFATLQYSIGGATWQNVYTNREIANSSFDLNQYFSNALNITDDDVKLRLYVTGSYAYFDNFTIYTKSGGSAPIKAAAGVSFTDGDDGSNEISGDVTITPAVDESDISHYRLYWGSATNTKIKTDPLIAEYTKTGGNITHTFSADTYVPAGATNIFVLSVNENGEMGGGVWCAINDDQSGGASVPTEAAANINFTDSDPQVGEIGGSGSIQKASDESMLSYYVVYFSEDGSTASGSAITNFAKDGSALYNYSVPADTALGSYSHIIVFTSNSGGMMASGTACSIVDSTTPQNAAAGLSFTDTDADSSEIGGDVTITAATDESDLTHYVLLFSDDGTSSTGAPLATIAADGSASYTHSVPADTALGSHTHFIVFTSNATGMMASGTAGAIVDSTTPQNAAAGVSFTDTDGDSGQIGGDVTITAASDESDVTHYVLLFSDDGTSSTGAPLATIAADDSASYTHSVAADTALGSHTHFIVFTSNATGMMASGTAGAISDVRGVGYFDNFDCLEAEWSSGWEVFMTDSGEGSNNAWTLSDVKVKEGPIGEDGLNSAHSLCFNPTDGSHVIFDGVDGNGFDGGITYVKYNVKASTSAGKELSIDYSIDGGAWINLATNQVINNTSWDANSFFSNEINSTSDNIKIRIVATEGSSYIDNFTIFTGSDSPVPINAAEGVSFTDTDNDSAQIGGDVTITAATDESDVTHYVLLFSDDGSSSTGAPLATIAADGSASYTHSVAENTALGSHTHFIVFTSNATGMMASGTAGAISDVSGGGDTTAPSVTITSGPTSDITTNETFTVTLTSDEESGYVSTGGGYSSFASTTNVEISATTTLSFFGEDAAGNVSATNGVSYTFDTTAPSVTISSGPTSDITTNETFTVTLTSDEESGYVSTGGAYSSFASTTNVEISATTTLSFFGADSLGNVSATNGVTYTFDTTAPSITLDPVSGFMSNASFDVTLSVGDGSGYWSTDGSSWTQFDHPADATVNVATENVTIEYYAVDELGNTSETNSANYSVTDAPIVSITSGPNVAITTNEAFTVGLSVTEDSGYWSTNGSAFTAFTSAGGASISIEDTTTLSYYGDNGSGDVSMTNSITYTFDTNAPSVTITSGPTSDITTNEAFTVTLTSDEESGYVSTDGSTFGKFADTTNVAISATTTLSFYGEDVLGNVSATNSNTYTVSVDTTAPTVTITSGPTSGITTNETFTVTLTNDEPNGYWSTNGSAYTEFASSASVTISNDTTLSYYGEDAAGNVSATNEVVYTFDTTAPTVTITSGPTSDITTNEAFTVTLTSDEESGYWSTNGSAYTEFASSASVTISNDTTLSYYGEDAAGNVSETNSVTYTVDMTAPSVTITSGPTADITTNAAFTVELGVTEDSGYWSTNGSAYTEFATSASVTISNDTTLSFYGEDSLGNVSATNSNTYTFDTNAPSVTITNGPSSSITTNETFTVELSVDEESGYVSTDGSNYNSFASTTNVEISATTTLSFYGKDELGNSNAVTELTYTFDTTAPTVTITSGPTSNVTNYAEFSVELSVDEPYGYFSTDGGSSFSQFTGTTNLTISETTTLSFYGKDTVGNVSETNELVYTIKIPTKDNAKVKRVIATPGNPIEFISTENVNVEIYTISGQMVYKQNIPAGTVSEWRAENSFGDKVAPGVYIVRYVYTESGETEVFKIIVGR